MVTMAPAFTSWNIIKIITSLLAVYVLGRLVNRFLRRRKYRLPPGPAGFPVVGTVRLHTHQTLLNHRQKFGDVSYINTLGHNVVILNSVEAIRDAMLGPETAIALSERPGTFAAKYLVFDDVASRSLSSENWKPLRQILHTLLKQYGEGIVVLDKVVSVELTHVIAQLDAHVGKRVNMDDYFVPSLMNILCILLIGERFDSSGHLIQVGSEMVRNMIAMSTHFVDILLVTFPFLRFLPFGPGSIFIKACKSREVVLDRLYRDLKKLSPEVLQSRKGIVYEMMRFQKENPWVKDSNIEGIVLDTFVAGFITTESSLRAMFLLFVHYPMVQAKIQKEIDEVTGDKRYPTIADRAEMPYTTATVLELTRYTAVVAMGVPHMSAKEIDFWGFTIPRGSIIFPNIYGIHHDERVWKNASEFLPERFLDESGNLLPATHPTRKNLIPFGVGKRMCMGENFAKTRLFLYVTYLLQSFTFKSAGEPPACHPRGYKPDGVLMPPDYEVMVERRKYVSL